jgi:hypothetical protein
MRLTQPASGDTVDVVRGAVLARFDELDLRENTSKATWTRALKFVSKAWDICDDDTPSTPDTRFWTG